MIVDTLTAVNILVLKKSIDINKSLVDGLIEAMQALSQIPKTSNFLDIYA